MTVVKSCRQVFLCVVLLFPEHYICISCYTNVLYFQHRRKASSYSHVDGKGIKSRMPPFATLHCEKAMTNQSVERVFSFKGSKNIYNKISSKKVILKQCFVKFNMCSGGHVTL